MITEAGFFGIVLNCGKKLKTLSLVNCFGVKHLNYAFPLESLVIRNCLGVGNVTIVVVGRLCHKLTHLELCI